MVAKVPFNVVWLLWYLHCAVVTMKWYGCYGNLHCGMDAKPAHVTMQLSIEDTPPWGTLISHGGNVQDNMHLCNQIYVVCTANRYCAFFMFHYHLHTRRSSECAY